LIQGGNRVVYVSVALQQRHPGCILSTQQANNSQVQRLLNRRQLWLEAPETRVEKFRTLFLQIRIRKLSHQDEHQFWILRRGDAVYGLQMFELRAVQLAGTFVMAA